MPQLRPASASLRPALLAIASLCAVGAQAATITGSLFDLEYDESGFPSGGFMITAPDTIRFDLRGDGDVMAGP
ncbi:MAG TPA: hypothetical protein VNO84_03825, partial [Burkholderiaceae bacterium]|nr:hypothetical protein [Burkholderiaceae bacterium]